MFGRLLSKTTLICSIAGISAVKFASLYSGGNETSAPPNYSSRQASNFQPSSIYQPSRITELNIRADTRKELLHSSFCTDTNKMDYREEANIIAQKALNLYNSTDWKAAKSSNENGNTDCFEKEVKVFYKKSSEFDGHVYRAECIIDAPADRVIQFILPSPRGLRGKWDKTVKESEVIEAIDDDLIVARSATHSVAMGLISSRDFCDLITVRRYPDDSIMCTNSKSIQRKDCPPKNGYVRAINYHGGTFCKTIEGETAKCQVVNIVQTDLSGMLPKSVVESALPANLIDFFRDLDAALKDNNLNST